MTLSFRQIDWNQARAFLTTAEEGSFSAAARKLRLTQPTLSRQVAALEDALDVVLFERMGRTVTLSHAGQDLLEHVREMGRAMEQVSLIASGQAQSVDGTVRITATDAFSAYLLPDMLERLYAKAPGIDVEIVADNTLQDLRRREADIAIRHVLPEDPDLVVQDLGQFEAHLYGAESYHQAHGFPKTPDELSGHIFMSSLDRQEHLEHMIQMGLTADPGQLKYTTSSGVVLWEMVRQGTALGIMAEAVTRNTPEVSKVFPSMAPLMFPAWLVCHREVAKSSRMRLVFDHLAGEMEALIGPPPR